MSIEEFIKTHVESLDELRALLLFHSRPDIARDADDTAGKLHILPAAATLVLESLVRKKILGAGGDPKRYTYQPASKELEELIHAVSELDREKPVTLIKMIYSKPKDVQALADAFKLRKES